jgi:hypothetical protein
VQLDVVYDCFAVLALDVYRVQLALDAEAAALPGFLEARSRDGAENEFGKLGLGRGYPQMMAALSALAERQIGRASCRERV